MAGESFKPMTSKQAKKAYKARGGIKTPTALEQRISDRKAALNERAEAIKEKEARRRENARKKELKDAKTAEMRAKQGLPPIPEPKVAASQPRIRSFFANYGSKPLIQPGELGKLETVGSDGQIRNKDDDANQGEDEGGPGERDGKDPEDTPQELMDELADDTFDRDDLSDATFWDGVQAQAIERAIACSVPPASPRPKSRKRRHSATLTRATTYVGRLPGDVVDPEVYVDRNDLYIPPSQNLLAAKRPRSAGLLDVSVSTWRAEFAQRLKHTPRSQSAADIRPRIEVSCTSHVSELDFGNDYAEIVREPWDEEDMMDIFQDIDALREQGVSLQGIQAGDPHQPHQDHTNNAVAEQDLLTECIEDWFPRDSQIQLSSRSAHDASTSDHAIGHTAVEASCTLHEASTRALALSSQRLALGDGTASGIRQLPSAPLANECNFEDFPNDSQVFAQQSGLEITADMFPSDSQALNSPMAMEDGATAQIGLPAYVTQHLAPIATTTSAREMDELIEGITSSQFLALDDEIFNETVLVAQPQPIANHIEDDDILRDLDPTEMRAAEFEVQATDAPRARSAAQPTNPEQVSDQAFSEYGELDISTQELRKLP